ncbi:MAG: hypothetical protein WCH39_27065, partial [Schlesneria sp.]
IFNAELKDLANERTIESRPPPETVPVPLAKSDLEMERNQVTSATMVGDSSHHIKSDLDAKTEQIKKTSTGIRSNTKSRRRR